MVVLTGTIEVITFYNPENGYSVLKVAPDKKMPQHTDRSGRVTVVGALPELGVGESVQFEGDWIEDPRYGLQLRAQTATPIVPTSIQGITRYLSSGIVKGIGPKTAEKIVDHFGTKTLDILNRDPQRLKEVPTLKPGLAEDLAKTWAENYEVRETMIFLQGYGVSAKMSNRIYGQFGGQTIQRVQEDPYTLADEVFGIGFIRADTIAQSMGLAADAPERLRAGLLYALNQLAMEGHTYAPRSVLIEKACELLGVDQHERLAALLDAQIVARNLVADSLNGHLSGRLKPDVSPPETTAAIYLPMYYRSEVGAAEYLREMANMPSMLTEEAADLDWDDFLSKIAKKNSVDLTPQQQSAVKAALTSKVTVLTGGPGTGKTTTLQMVIAALDELDYGYALASPTGRAAKRLSEATGRNASTIHRLLGYSAFGEFAHDEDSPLEIDVLIVDEASMIDLILFYHLMKALMPETHLMLVGDVDQLPSVGAGNVLHDVIDSGIAHVTRLQTIFRQSDDSHIIINAHRVNKGEAPFMDNQSEDFFFFGQDDPYEAANLVVDIVKNRIPEKFGYDPLNDIQVIAPMYRGDAGINKLNERLQAALNGNKRHAEKVIGSRVYRVGDKVMQTRNNYEKEVFNGDIGRLYGIDFDDNTFEVAFDGRFVFYEFSEAEELIHAFCISTHRSQGSEYPVVVMPVLTQHYMMLQRNLMYTAITRAKEVVVMVGNRKAVYMAVKNNNVAERFSGLLPRLKGGTKRLL